MLQIVVKSFFLTVVTLLLTYLTSKLSQTAIFKTVFPETIALEEFEITDVAFKSRRAPELNQQIILINTEGSSRRQIADQIKIISKHRPRVIAIDQIFNCPGNMQDTLNCPERRDVQGNAMLAKAIRQAKNVVLATRLNLAPTPEESSDSVQYSDDDFRESARSEGYTDLETEPAYTGGAKTCRQFSPTMSVNGRLHYSFAVQTAKAYDSSAANHFLARNNFNEIINYRGNTYQLSGQTDYPPVFYAIEGKDVLEGNYLPTLFRDRIVIFGFVGSSGDDKSWKDKYYTPLNTTIAGKTIPDMFGVVIHANIVSMILEYDYVDRLSEVNEFVFAFFVCLLHIYILLIIKQKMPQWFEVFSLMLIFGQLVLYSYLRIFSMQLFSYKLTLIVTLGSLAIASLSINMSSAIFETLKNRRFITHKVKGHAVEKVLP